MRVKIAREKQTQARDKRASLLEATLQSSNTKEAKLLLSDEVNSKISKDLLKKKLKVEKAKDVERQSMQKILQKSIDKTRKVCIKFTVETPGNLFPFRNADSVINWGLLIYRPTPFNIKPGFAKVILMLKMTYQCLRLKKCWPIYKYSRLC